MQIAIVAPSHVPYIVGGAEKMWWGMLEYVNKHTRHQCDLIRIPAAENGFWKQIDSYYAFYHLDLSHFDLVISGKFPSWMVQHQNQHLYMLHPDRGFYDLLRPSFETEVRSEDPRIINLSKKLDGGTSTIDEIFNLIFGLREGYGNSGEKPFERHGALMYKIIRFLDKKAMENIKCFSAISQTVAERADYFPTQAQVEVIYPPSNLSGLTNRSSDYFFTVSRLDHPKRIEMMVEAYLKSSSTLPLKIAGVGPVSEKLAELSKDDSRIELLGFISDTELVDYYSRAYAVIFIPREEDYGLVTIEAMMCEKPVLTFSDTGGVLEFVEDRVTGLVSEPTVDELTQNIDFLAANPKLCKKMGKRARKKVKNITWANAVDALLKDCDSSDNPNAKAGETATRKIRSPGVDAIMKKIKTGTEKHEERSSGTQQIDYDKILKPREVPIEKRDTGKTISMAEKSFEQKDEYTIFDFLHYYDIEYITNLYRGVLKREPDTEGMRQNLDLLRSGDRSRMELLTAIRFSPEGKTQKVTILGIKKRYLASKIYCIPFIGYIARLLTLPRIIKRVNRIEAMSHAELPDLLDEENHQLDAFYLAFEDKFRGTREDIKQRVASYLPCVEALPFEKNKIEILDVGCGRGEWLELLGEHGYSAHGLDLNRVMVATSKKLGLDVREADVVSYLRSLDDNSLSVITGFHIIEHLPFAVLVQMFDEALRVLKPGGMVIFETPNPENLQVGAYHFYADPTHINPIPHYTAKFILEERGFSNVKIRKSHKYADYFPTVTDDEFVRNNFYNEMDYAVIGYKMWGHNG